MPPTFVGLILAAGASSRMGRPKALLPIGTTTFVEHQVQTMARAGLQEVIVVTNDQLLAEVTRLLIPRSADGLRVLCNPQPELGQLSSLLIGLDAADDLEASAVIVCPVDVPTFQASTVAALLDAAAHHPSASIVRPSWQGKHGHPVVFMRSIFADLRRADLAHGARPVVHAHAATTVNVEVNDPGAFRDIDTPEQYLRLEAGPR